MFLFNFISLLIWITIYCMC